jgi:hypothetical protein
VTENGRRERAFLSTDFFVYIFWCLGKEGTRGLEYGSYAGLD